MIAAPSPAAADLDAVEAGLVEALARVPGVRSVALLGSFAQRRPARDAAGRILSDADAVVVVDAARFLGLVRRQHALEGALTRRLGIACTLAPMTPGLLRRAPPTIFSAELKFGGRTLHGPDFLTTIPLARPADVDPVQGPLMMLNYLYELARLRRTDEGGEASQVMKVSRAALAASAGLAAAWGRFDTDLQRCCEEASGILRGEPGPLRDAWGPASERAWALRRAGRGMDPDAYVSWHAEADALLHHAILRAARHLAPDPAGARASLARVLAQRQTRASSLEFQALRLIHQRRFRGLRPGARAPATTLRLALFDLTDARPMREREAVARDVARVLGPAARASPLDAVLAAWRAAAPAYALFPSRPPRAEPPRSGSVVR